MIRFTRYFYDGKRVDLITHKTYTQWAIHTKAIGISFTAEIVHAEP